MSHKGDWSRVKDQKAYDEQLDKIKKAKSEGFCVHHYHNSMRCDRCENDALNAKK